MHDWLDDLLARPANSSPDKAFAESLAQACVLISVVQTQGSCPRDAGTRMLVALDTCSGTIGGGHLEYQAIATARELLNQADPCFRIERVPLAARVGQCCGGVVHLSFEYIPVQRPPWVAALSDATQGGHKAVLVSAVDGNTRDNKLVVTSQGCIGALPDPRQYPLAKERALQLLSHTTSVQPVLEESLVYELIDNTQLHIAIFGAGHVGKALVNTLCALPCRIRWIDSRAREFPNHIPSNVQLDISDQPEAEVDELPAGSLVVIMAHSHALDCAICERVLSRDDLAWCGLLGSRAKRRQFEKRLLARGLTQAALKKLICPIGIDGITGKHPAQIAIAVAAQIVLLADAR